MPGTLRTRDKRGRPAEDSPLPPEAGAGIQLQQQHRAHGRASLTDQTPKQRTPRTENTADADRGLGAGANPSLERQ